MFVEINKQLMRNIIQSIGSFIGGSIYFVLGNMGTVLLLFSMLKLPLITSVIITILSTVLFSITGTILIARIAGRAPRNHSLAVLIYLSIMTVGSIIINQSLEPTWYKIIYIVLAWTTSLIMISRLNPDGSLKRKT